MNSKAEKAVSSKLVEWSQYEHSNCGETTFINDSVIITGTLDPWFFPLYETDCECCGVAHMRDVTLSNGQSLFESFKELRAEVPLSGKIARFIGIPFGFVGLGAIVGTILVIIGRARNGGQFDALPTILLCSGFGFMAGCFAIRYIFKELRRNGLFW